VSRFRLKAAYGTFYTAHETELMGGGFYMKKPARHAFRNLMADIFYIPCLNSGRIFDAGPEGRTVFVLPDFLFYSLTFL